LQVNTQPLTLEFWWWVCCIVYICHTCFRTHREIYWYRVEMYFMPIQPTLLAPEIRTVTSFMKAPDDWGFWILLELLHLDKNALQSAFQKLSVLVNRLVTHTVLYLQASKFLGQGEWSISSSGMWHSIMPQRNRHPYPTFYML
jgi:hypothetical protein